MPLNPVFCGPSEMSGPTPRRSRFVTIIGWLCCVLGGLGILAQLIALGDLGQVLSRPGASEAAVEALGGASLHPIVRFQLEHLVLMAALQLAQAILCLVVGVGLLQRGAWALPLGGGLLVIGALRQGSSLIVAMSSQPILAPGMSAAEAKAAASVLVPIYVASMVWLGFLVWKFRRPAIRQEFTE